MVLRDPSSGTTSVVPFQLFVNRFQYTFYEKKHFSQTCLQRLGNDRS